MTGNEVVSFKGLKELGLPYSRTHIDRLEKAKMCPASFKLHASRGGRRVWWLKEWLEWFRTRTG
jgi:hypothetical protein